MQRLLSFKIVSEIPRKLSNTSFLESRLCKSFFSVTERNPKQLLNSSATQPLLFSHICFRSYCSWRSQHSLSQRIYGFGANPVFLKQVIYGFLANPLFVKQVISNTHLRIPSKSLYETGVRFLRSQLPKQNFEFNFKPQSYYSRRSWRSWFSRFSADDVVLGLILANISVFFLWKIADPTFMRKHFMISVENFTSGRVHTLITSAFSHIDVEHIVSNMIGLYFFGMNVGRLFGPEFLLKLYLAGAVGGSIFYLVHHAFMVPKNQGMWNMDPSKVPGLGASGAVNAIMLFDIFMFPTATIYFQLIIPVPAILLGAVLIGKDIWRIMEGDSQISGSAHLGGAAVAALAWARIRKRWI